MRNNIIVFVLVAFNVCALIWSMSKDKELESKKQILEIKQLRQEIIRMDSLNNIRQAAIVDSVKTAIEQDKGEIKAIHSINNKLQKLNEKTDRIYSAVTVDMPDL